MRVIKKSLIAGMLADSIYSVFVLMHFGLNNNRESLFYTLIYPAIAMTVSALFTVSIKSLIELKLAREIPAIEYIEPDRNGFDFAIMFFWVAVCCVQFFIIGTVIAAGIISLWMVRFWEYL